MTLPEIRERLLTFGADSPNIRPEDFAAYVRADVERTVQLVRQLGIVAEQ
jgi:tripartite-type tricarboxylate transporter receptor subunit TctC